MRQARLIFGLLAAALVCYRPLARHFTSQHSRPSESLKSKIAHRGRPSRPPRPAGTQASTVREPEPDRNLSGFEAPVSHAPLRKDIRPSTPSARRSSEIHAAA